MRYASPRFLLLLCITFSSPAPAQDTSWKVKIAEDSPFARLVALRGNDEIMALACIRSDVPDSALTSYGLTSELLLPKMKASNSLAILVEDTPSEGKSTRLNLEYLNQGTVFARSQMGYVDSFGAYFTELRPADGFLEFLKSATALKFQKARPDAESFEADFSGVFREQLPAMVRQHCHTGVATALGLIIEPPERGSIGQSIEWKPASGWSPEQGPLFLLRRHDENGLATQLLNGSGQQAATLTTLDKKLTPSLHHDFLIDAGNRYFFRAPHSDNGRAVGALSSAGELSLLQTEDRFALALHDAAALGDGWILAAGGLFHLSASDELNELSATPVAGRYPADLTRVGNRVVYVDHHPEYEAELFATDGTTEGTGIVLDINDQAYRQGRTRGSSPALEHAVVINDRVVFTAVDGSIPANSHNTFHIWSSDGTADGTMRLPTDGYYSYYSDFIEFEGRLYVTARPRGNGDEVLYSTDGTAGGTRALASAQSLVKAAGGDPERNRAFLGEPTRVGNRLILPLLGSPLGQGNGNPLFEISADGELEQLSVTRENIGNHSGRLRQTGVAAGGRLLYSGVVRKESTRFAGFEVVTVIRSIDPDTGEIETLYELRSGEALDWSNLPQRLPLADAVAFGTRHGGSRNLVITDGTAAGTRSLSQLRNPRIAAFAVSDSRIAWLENDVFFSFTPGEAQVITLFDPVTTQKSRPGNAILGTIDLP